MRIDESNVFAIGGLLDEGVLAVHGKDGEDEVVFEIGELMWGSDGTGEGEAWCQVGEWEGWFQKGMGARVSFFLLFWFDCESLGGFLLIWGLGTDDGMCVSV